MYTHMHAYIHTHIHTHIHTCTHICINIHIHIHTHTHTFTHTYIHIRIHIHVQYIFIYIRTLGQILSTIRQKIIESDASTAYLLAASAVVVVGVSVVAAFAGMRALRWFRRA